MAEGGTGPSEDDLIESIERPPENTLISNRIILTEAITGEPKIIVNNAKVVTSGDITIYNYGRRESKPKKIKPSKPLTTSTEHLSIAHLHYISERLGKLWLKLGRCLKFEDAALDQLDLDHSGDSNEKNYKMLSRWVSQEGDQATKAELARCLAACGLGKLADYLADH